MSDLDPGRARRGGVERALHVLADRAAHARQLLPLRRRRRRVGAVGRLRVQRRILRRGRGVDEREDVLLAHAAVAARAPDRIEVDAVLGRDALDDRRVAPRVRGRLRLGLRHVGLAGARVRRDPRERGADVDGHARLHEHLGQPAGRRRRDLGVDLVRGDLGERLVGLHPVADLLVPGDDRALGDGHAHLGHRDVDERLSRRGAHGTPPVRDRRWAAPPAPAVARTGSARRARTPARPARRGPRSPSRR